MIQNGVLLELFTVFPVLAACQLIVDFHEESDK